MTPRVKDTSKITGFDSILIDNRLEIFRNPGPVMELRIGDEYFVIRDVELATLLKKEIDAFINAF